MLIFLKWMFMFLKWKLCFAGMVEMDAYIFEVGVEVDAHVFEVEGGFCG